jgi:hypothetical protein
MSGLLRRFRRGKPKEEEDAEVPDAPEEVREGDTDIYPHRGPGRPRRGDDEPAPDESPAGVEEGGEVIAPPAALPDEIGPAVEPEIEASPPAAPVPEVVPVPEIVPDGPSTAPPRLPEAADGGTRSAHRPLNAPGHCFLCGAELSGSFCPVCRMTWNE